MHLITFGQTSIPYEIVRSHKRKTVSITVDKDGVKVIAPDDVEIEKVQDIVKDKVIWIRKQLLHFEEINDDRHQRLFLSGEKLPYLGRQYRLKVISNTEIAVPNFKFSQGTFLAEVPATINKDQYRDALFPLYEDWIKTKALKYVNNRISRYTTILQINPSTISIKNQEQRWGSCTPSGKVLLNWRIFLAPVSVIDYVLIHELAHLKHLNHSTQFWETIKMLQPNYEEKKDWLRINGPSLYI
ncbi:SprT family zinc-dependent metalloprotease [Sporosarcina sp. YIM B06819]|uniref:M48 family metallopeptidase n=1 Tax=Sporosarcina sp. YIM B06819 TaxID=3081769 RepID=UPI00298BFA83|nr:SprT family zinc-dependent metalloprotease [Sporosarcina sp. YIM B06819]